MIIAYFAELFSIIIYMSRQSEEVKINRAVKAIKWGGAALFFAVNLYLGFRFFSAYGDGQMRGEALHE